MIAKTFYLLQKFVMANKTIPAEPYLQGKYVHCGRIWRFINMYPS